MDKREAIQILEKEILFLRQQSYLELCRYMDKKRVDTKSIEGDSGTKYQVEIQSFWDSRPGHNLRVVVSIDDGGLRTFFPLSKGFIIAPDGSFVGE